MASSTVVRDTVDRVNSDKEHNKKTRFDDALDALISAHATYTYYRNKKYDLKMAIATLDYSDVSSQDSNMRKHVEKLRKVSLKCSNWKTAYKAVDAARSGKCK